MRFGSALETMARAAMVSPEASVTPVGAAVGRLDARHVGAGPDLDAGLTRRRRQRVGERCRPPAANQPLATGCPSPAPSISSTAALPADHGPRNDPSTPPAAIVARSGSLSNHSPARSATAIGIQRSSRYASALPSARNARPAFSSSIEIGRAGIVDRRRRRRRDRADARGRSSRSCQETRVLLGVLRENARMLPLARATSFHSIRARPSSVGAHASAAGRTIRNPCCSRSERPHEMPDRSPPQCACSAHAVRGARHARGERLQARSSEQRRGHQTVHASADHDNVHSRHHEDPKDLVIMPADPGFAGRRCGRVRP